jgi:hypothetical protein
MTDRKITLEEVCDAWRHGQRGKASGHLPTSTLFDLMQQSLDGDEKLAAFQHLVECAACLEDLRAMMKIRGTVLIVEMPLARVANASPIAFRS